MVKILFGISGVGNGHVTRSAAVIEHLKKHHKIIAVTEGNAYEFLKRKCNVKNAKGFHLAYKKNKVVFFGTFWINIKNFPGIIRAIRDIRRIIKDQKPDIIINDFSAIVNALGLLYRIPIITIDNEHLLLKTKLNIPMSWWWSKLKATLAIRFMVQTASFRFIPSFFIPEVTSTRAKIIQPILRKEIQHLKSKKANHILVYQTSDSNDILIDMLKHIKGTFIVYGFKERGTHANVTFKPFSEKPFLKDLASAKAVIMNGGFSLMTECIHLNKPILSIPVQHQIEQMINAKKLEELGLGRALEKNDQQAIEEFLDNLGKYHKNLRKYSFDSKKFYKQLEKKIKQLT